MSGPTKNVLLKDVAKEAGVSPALASFVLNGLGGRYRVNAETAKHIKKVAKWMNYVPNMAARSLRSGKSRIIGVVVSDVSNPFFSQIARNIENVATKLGYTVFFGSSDESVVKMDIVVSGLVSRYVDGLIIVPCENSEGIIKQLIENKTPLVLLDRHYDNINVSSVTLNNFVAGHEATEHLIKQGYKRIGIVAYDTSLQHMKERILGYCEAMRMNGQGSNITIGYVKQTLTHESVPDVINSMINDGVDAFFFATNTISIACLQYINKIKLNVPEQYGIVGFDGSDAFEIFYSPLSYINQPIGKLATKAVEALVDVISGDNATSQRLMINGDLIINASSQKILKP